MTHQVLNQGSQGISISHSRYSAGNDGSLFLPAHSQSMSPNPSNIMQHPNQQGLTYPQNHSSVTCSTPMQSSKNGQSVSNQQSSHDQMSSAPISDANRESLRPLALAIVSEAWSTSATPADFISSVRARLPNALNSKPFVVDDSSSPKINSSISAAQESPGSVKSMPSDLLSVNGISLNIWQLPSASEGAILDALFVKIINCDAASSRLMSYLSYSLVTGIVSQRAVLSTCHAWVGKIPPGKDHALQSFARFMTQILPFYKFTIPSPDVTSEVGEFLSAFLLVVKCASEVPTLSSELASVLMHDRVVALIRACARREPAIWQKLHVSLSQLNVPPVTNRQGRVPSLPSQSAVEMTPYLTPLIARVTHGLAVGVTPFESIATSIGVSVSSLDNSSIASALQTTFSISGHLFGKDVLLALRELWSQREGLHGDSKYLVDLDRAAKLPSFSSHHSSSAVKYALKTNVQACEAIVRFLAEKASVPGMTDKWSWSWGGKDRLKRIVVNALPQVKNEIRSEGGALLVAMAVVSCAAMCLGPALRMKDANDGVQPRDEQELALLQRQNEEVEDAVSELTAFAVFSLEQAATAEEVPAWKSIGLWLLLLMSKAGSMLRASGCDHVRAARVLRVWGGMPTGTPGTHTAHGGSSHKHPSQGNGGHQVQGSSSSVLSEGVTLFAESASLAIIDVSDATGSDDTIEAICDDLVQ